MTNQIPAADASQAVLKSSARQRPRKRNVALAASIFLASCEGTITTDLTVVAPADPDLQQVVAPFTGVEFRRSDGNTETFTFDDPERIDLLTLASSGTPVRLLSDEELPEGTYTGLRLLFDEEDTNSAYVIDGLGAQRDLAIVNGEFVEMDFTVEEDERSSEDLTVTLDLRMSLSVDSDNQYTLRPLLRSVRTEDAGELTGSVTASCLNTSETNPRGAVYLFRGRNITPDDIDGQGTEPYATAPVLLNGNGFNYRIDFIAPGSYTVALVCDGDEEDPTADDDLNFRGISNVEIDEGETTEHDISA